MELDRIARVDAKLFRDQMAECPEPDPALAVRRDCCGMQLSRYEGSALRALREDRRRAASDQAATGAETQNYDSNPIPPSPATHPAR